VNALECRSSDRTRRFAPRLEALETRFCPSVSVAASGHTLTIQGDNTAGSVTINDDGHGDVYVITTGSAGTTRTSARSIDTILVNTGDGNDNVFYRATGTLAHDLNLVVQLGAGNDRVDTSFLPGIAGRRVNLDLLGGSGHDQVTGRFGTVTDATVTVRSWPGSGDDTFNYYLPGHLLGHSQMSFLAQGGSGTATVGLHAGNTYISANALLEADMRGGTGHNVTSLDFSGVLDGRLYARSYGGSGSQRLVTNLSVGAGSTGTLDVASRGGSGSNVTTFTAYDHSHGVAAALAGALASSSSGLKSCRMAVQGSGGHDIDYVTSNVQAENLPPGSVFLVA
jgi:hypothetical protein